MEGLERYISEIDTKKDELCTLSDEIWGLAETAYSEKESVKALTEYLEKQGFTVECPAYGIDTAFTAAYTNDKVSSDSECNPKIGLLGEFDALSGLSQVAGLVEKKAERSGAAGHGCGHNMLGVASVAAALSVKKYLEDGHKGTVVYYGCPAEEGGSGKAFMARNGAFKDLDAAITWHPDFLNCVVNDSSLANFQVLYTFKGRSAHAAACPELGRSALDALELMNVGVNFLREHMEDQARIHYAITDAGGYSPNVVQSSAKAIYLVRAPKQSSAYELLQRVEHIARGAAEMTETEVSSQFIKSCANYMSNPVLEKVLYEAMNEIPLPEYSDEELELAERYRATNPVGSDGLYIRKTEDLLDRENRRIMNEHKNDSILRFVVPYEELHRVSIGGGSTDVGDVSFQCPTGQIHAATWAAGTPGHSWQVVSQGKTSYAHKGMLYAGKCMALSVMKLMEQPETLLEAKDRFTEMMEGEHYMPVPEGVVPRAMDSMV